MSKRESEKQTDRERTEKGSKIEGEREGRERERGSELLFKTILLN